jgi:hypothetical protein
MVGETMLASGCKKISNKWENENSVHAVITKQLHGWAGQHACDMSRGIIMSGWRRTSEGMNTLSEMREN